MRKYFPEAKAATKPTDSIMPEHKPFRPFLEDEARPAKAALPSPLIDTLPEPTPGEIAYQSIRGDREFWPFCEA
jgi:hypothetical protein